MNLDEGFLAIASLPYFLLLIQQYILPVVCKREPSLFIRVDVSTVNVPSRFQCSAEIDRFGKHFIITEIPKGWVSPALRWIRSICCGEVQLFWIGALYSLIKQEHIGELRWIRESVGFVGVTDIDRITTFEVAYSIKSFRLYCCLLCKWRRRTGLTGVKWLTTSNDFAGRWSTNGRTLNSAQLLCLWKPWGPRDVWSKARLFFFEGALLLFNASVAANPIIA